MLFPATAKLGQLEAHRDSYPVREIIQLSQFALVSDADFFSRYGSNFASVAMVFIPQPVLLLRC